MGKKLETTKREVLEKFDPEYLAVDLETAIDLLTSARTAFGATHRDLSLVFEPEYYDGYGSGMFHLLGERDLTEKELAANAAKRKRKRAANAKAKAKREAQRRKDYERLRKEFGDNG